MCGRSRAGWQELPWKAQTAPRSVGRFAGSLFFFMSPCLCLPGPPRGTSHPHGDVGVSPHPPACEGWPEPQLSLRLTEAFCTFSPGCNRDLSTRAESSWDRAVVARPAFTDQTKVNLHYLLLGLTDRGSSSWKGLDLIISTSLASKASPKPGNSELMPSVTSNKASGSLPRRFTVSDG